MKVFTRSLALLFLLSIVCALRAADLRADSLDIRSVKLQLNFTDFTNKIMQGHATLGVKGKVNGNTQIRLDLLLLTVDSAKVNGQSATTTYNDSVLTIPFAASLNTNDSATVEVFYHGHPLQQAGDFGGFYWTATHAANIGVSFLADPHTYGRVWFPCFDNFVQRSYYDFFITTQLTHKAFCNGTLLGVTNEINQQTWHWKLADNIPSYLASVAISDYQTLTDSYIGMNGTVPVQLAARAPDTANMLGTFANLHNAFDIYESQFGPYVWERIGYCIMPTAFAAGAMEHATNIAIMPQIINGTTAYESIVVHELSHHWWGDLVTCDKASEMWLNEGWAVYSEMVFYEGLYGTQRYKDEVRLNHERVLHLAHVKDGAYYPVNGVPSEQTYGETVYNKGSDMVHTLRSYMGDAQFFNCAKSYLTTYSFQHVNSNIQRDYFAQCSGNSAVNDFYSDWIFQPGFPHFSIDAWENIFYPTDGGLTKVYVRQRLNHADHLFNNVPVTVSFFLQDGTREDVPMTISGECGYIERSLNSWNPPVYVALDFDEKLSDAITDEWRVMDSTALYDFGTAKMKVTVTQIVDSALLRVEHNWVAPELMATPIPGLHLHDYRYWTVDGILPTTFDAFARIDYNGTTTDNGWLDNTFITTNEDSIVVMYRPDAQADWWFADSFIVNKQGSATNKTGFATIYHLQKGQYCLAIWDHARPDTSVTITPCEDLVGVEEVSAATNDFRLYPNPTSRTARIEMGEAHHFTQLELLDLLGRKVMEELLAPSQPSFDINLRGLRRGIYLVSLTDASGVRVPKRLVKQ